MDKRRLKSTSPPRSANQQTLAERLKGSKQKFDDPLTGQNLSEQFLAFLDDGKIIAETEDIKSADDAKFLRLQLNRANAMIQKMRVDCTKEVTHLQDQLAFLRGNHRQTKGFVHIDVRYFDATELLDRDMRDVLNKKIEYTKSKYEAALNGLEEVNNRQQT